MSDTAINKIIPYILRPAFAKKLKSPTKDDINKLYTEISSEDKKKPTFFEKRSLMDYIATSVLGVGVLSSIVGHFKENKGLLSGGGAVAIAGIAGFIYKFIKTPALEKLTNITKTENTDVEPEVDLSGEMSPEYKQWLIDVKKDIYDQPDYSARIRALSKRDDLSDEEKAELAGLKEFPDNPKMAELVEIKTLGKEPITPVEEAVLKSVRQVQRIRSKKMFASDQKFIDRLKRMINEDKEAFLQDLKDLLIERPLNLLLSDESFKHVLYQRYQAVTTVGSKGRENYADRGGNISDDDWKKLYRKTNNHFQDSGDVLSKDEALDVFTRVEGTRKRLIDEGETAIPKYDFNEVKREKAYVKGLRNGFTVDGEQVYSNTICQCSHGGGYRYLQLILSGKHPGSKLEHQEARGFQVHPFTKGDYASKSENVYAERSEYYFDTKSVLYFRVEAKHLDSEPNWYEAGIRSEFLEHATDFRLENLVTGEVLRGDNLREIREAIEKSKIGIGDF